MLQKIAKFVKKYLPYALFSFTMIKDKDVREKRVDLSIRFLFKRMFF